ncbi:F-box domain protein [Metarhizium guizhouense ARSEF 977]|uniref:F-box domain protein n=1 Tax=Metarhizium guizhouense (strain ARSEF 977) TaxID=1276136 RepID=A0A0B4GN90_METGA|nr:F-box domain protein [Metarhizium guizhouense ARSEF 977]
MAAHSPDPAAWKISASSSHHDAATNLSILAEGQTAARLIQAHVAEVAGSPRQKQPGAPSTVDISAIPSRESLHVGLAALDIFLQANVTGPVVPADRLALIQSRFSKAWTAPLSADTDQSAALTQLHKACLAHLEVDGVSPYSYIPHLELFSLARYVFDSVLASETMTTADVYFTDEESRSVKYSLSWIRLRINIWHYKLLTQPSLGPGSNFTKSSQWSEVPSLVSRILIDMDTVRDQIAGNEVWSEAESWGREDKAYFLVEAANNYILLGRHEKAKDALKEAAQLTGLKYALSGALGKRTKFQENSVSQLVVLARSNTDQDLIEEDGGEEEEKAKPDALKLDDDTLLEEIQFSNHHDKDGHKEKELPPSLADVSPDNQPQLAPLDQIILLTEATLKDAFSPVDTLTSQEVLPYAVRVLADKSTNWQIYTQALLVRSRIEVHRSRTVERGVLQLQAVADQVLTDTNVETEPTKESDERATNESDVPAIQVTAPGHENAVPSPKAQVPTSFLPAPKATESAPAHVRLRYIDALSTPPRWHLESELAYAWAGVGSLTSALEIFKRLRLWAEVALCYASAAASEDEDGRGSGGDEKAKSIVRWRLFHPTAEDASATSDPDDQDVEDVMHLKATSFEGPERSPPPPNAARLWCILGDLENNPKHYEQAWIISKQRYARAQKSLGEYYLAQKDMAKAREAYKLATSVNRLSPDLWSRLGDISLRLGQFDDAAEAYSRSIGTANDVAGGEDARTWSNLGSALWSLYCEVTAEKKDTVAANNEAKAAARADDEEEDDILEDSGDKSRDPATLLSKSLAAYKKGASIAHDNWRIWDNVLTLAARMQPSDVPDMVLAFTHILRIRKTEDAIDADVLTALLQDVVISKEKPAGTGIYEPPRGSMERLVTRLLEEEIVPLITHRAELWSLLSRLRTWRRDYAGAIDASERAWRAAVGSSGSGLLPGEVAADSVDWTTDLKGWTEVVKRTDELVSILENWAQDVDTVGSKWKGKARSAIRSVMSRGKENWEGSEGWNTLEALMEGLKVSK